MPETKPPSQRATCPDWCVQRHGASSDEHVSHALRVRGTLLRLVSVAEQDSSAGPHVLVGDREYTLHEAEVLIAALTQLVVEARAATSPAVPRMRRPGP